MGFVLNTDPACAPGSHLQKPASQLPRELHPFKQPGYPRSQSWISLKPKSLQRALYSGPSNASWQLDPFKWRGQSHLQSMKQDLFCVTPLSEVAEIPEWTLCNAFCGLASFHMRLKFLLVSEMDCVLRVYSRNTKMCHLPSSSLHVPCFWHSAPHLEGREAICFTKHTRTHTDDRFCCYKKHQGWENSHLLESLTVSICCWCTV